MQTSFKWDYYQFFFYILLKLLSIVIYFKRLFHMVLYINIISSNSLIIVRHECARDINV